MDTTVVAPDGVVIGWEESGEGRSLLLVQRWLTPARGPSCTGTCPTDCALWRWIGAGGVAAGVPMTFRTALT